MPKIFRMTKGGKLVEGIFEGETHQHAVDAGVEDYLDALKWAESIGGLKALIARVGSKSRRARALGEAKRRWADFLAQDEGIRSNTSVCLKIIDPWFRQNAGRDPRRNRRRKSRACSKKKACGLDIGGHRNAPPGLRIWCGATVEQADIEALTPWLDWAWAQVKADA